MKKLKISIIAKMIAFILFVALALAVTGCTIGCITFANWGGYSESYQTVRVNALKELAWNKLYECYDMYMNGLELDDIDKNTNFRFSIYDEKRFCKDIGPGIGAVILNYRASPGPPASALGRCSDCR